MIRCYTEDLDPLHLPRGLLDEAAKIVEPAGWPSAKRVIVPSPDTLACNPDWSWQPADLEQLRLRRDRRSGPSSTT
jgi:hypothetical protein